MILRSARQCLMSLTIVPRVEAAPRVFLGSPYSGPRASSLLLLSPLSFLHQLSQRSLVDSAPTLYSSIHPKGELFTRLLGPQRAHTPSLKKLTLRPARSFTPLRGSLSLYKLYSTKQHHAPFHSPRFFRPRDPYLFGLWPTRCRFHRRSHRSRCRYWFCC